MDQGVGEGTYKYEVIAYYNVEGAGEVEGEIVNVPSTVVTIDSPVVTREIKHSFGGGKNGSARAVLDRLSGKLNVTTQTWTNSELQGFTMGMKVWGVDKHDIVVFAPQGESYGVDGKMVPYGAPSNRTDIFSIQLDPGKSKEVAQLYVVLFHAPKNRVASIIKKVGEEGKKIMDAVNGLCKDLPELCAAIKAQAGMGM